MKRLISAVICGLLTMTIAAQIADVTYYNIIDPERGTVSVDVQWYTPTIVRILKTLPGNAVKKQSLSVIAHPDNGLKIKNQVTADDLFVIKGEKLTVTVDMNTGTVAFAKTDGTELLRELKNTRAFTPFNDAGNATYSVYQGFATDPDEGLYGLGQLQDGKMMQRNMTKLLVQGNTEDSSPFFLSTKGYGVFWDNYSGTTYKDSAEGTSFLSEVGECIDYYFIYGGDADGVIAGVRALTGDVPMMPLWSYGFLQSKERYKSQEETVGVVREYRNHGIPLDCIIQDWQYWGNNYLWNAMDFQNPLFSQPQAMIDSVHGMNAKMMISIWSSFGPATKPYRALEKEGLLFDIETWPQSGLEGWPPNMDYPSGVRVYDPYSAKARDIYWHYLNEGIFKLGMDAWWMDSTEPDHFNQKSEDFDRQTALGTYRSVRNAFPLVTVGGVSEHQRATTTDKRVFILTRSGFLGQQRYGANVWSGDVQSSWDMLRKQVTAALNFSLTGMPHWNSDIGGFFASSYNNNRPDGAIDNPMFRELYVRWMQFGALCPLMRSHGADVSREIYRYGNAGEPIYDALVGAVKLRYSLLPYIYSTSWEVSHDRSTFMRALVMDFAGDRATWDIGDEYMFGRSLLVAPVLHAQYTPEQTQRRLQENEGWNRDTRGQGGSGWNDVDFSRSYSRMVYLPAGAKWYNYRSNELFDGGDSVTVATTIADIPLFVRAGSIVPIGPDVQYTSEKPWDNLILKVYPGADGRFTLYEDEGDSYRYEQGAYSEIPMVWSDKKRVLTIGKRQGVYEGMLTTRKFTIILPDGASKEVIFTGKTINVKL